MKKLLPLLAVFVLCFSLCVPASAIGEWGDWRDFPSPYTVWTDQETFPYAFVYEQGTGAYPQLYLCSQLPTVYGDISDNAFNLHKSNDGRPTYEAYFYNPEIGSWQFLNRSVGSNALMTTSYMVTASFNLVHEDSGTVLVPWGSDFFMIPLPEMIQGVTTEALTTQTVPALGGATKIIVLCGVGLMASLVVLSLFGKRSLISLR